MKTLKWRGLIVSVIGLALVHCSTGENIDVTSDAMVSGCDGFNNSSEYGDLWSTSEEDGYCDAERLVWDYEDGTLTLRNTRVLLNCCGEHSISIVEESYGSYIVEETDVPLDGGTRCRCNCVYDFMVTTEYVPEDVISIKLVRKVINHETSEERTVLETQLDMYDYSGSVVVSTEDVGHSCK